MVSEIHFSAISTVWPLTPQYSQYKWAYNCVCLSPPCLSPTWFVMMPTIRYDYHYCADLRAGAGTYGIARTWMQVRSLARTPEIMIFVVINYVANWCRLPIVSEYYTLRATGATQIILHADLSAYESLNSKWNRFHFWRGCHHALPHQNTVINAMQIHAAWKYQMRVGGSMQRFVIASNHPLTIHHFACINSGPSHSGGSTSAP